MELFENWLHDTVNDLEGIPVISVRGLMQMKKQIGRDKDLRDLLLIEHCLCPRITLKTDKGLK